MKRPKIAIFHNYMDNIGGAELVTISLAKHLDAEIFTTNIDSKKIEKMGGQGLKITSIGTVPVNAPFRQQWTLWRFRNLNLTGKFDAFIIAGDWAVSAAVNNHPNIWYIHSPIREIWDLYEYTRKNIVAPWKRPAFDIWVHLNRYLTKSYVDQVDDFFCNSINTHNRVQKFLGRNAEILPPPTQINDFSFQSFGDYWLSVNRLISHKRIEVQLEAFRHFKDEKLIVVGCYEKSDHFQEYAKRMHSIAPPNVRFISWVDRKELVDLYANCKGVISTALDEDFGLTAVEAMASGKPMIAPSEGGYLETIEHLKTGYLIQEVNAKGLVEAISQVSQNLQSFKLPCLERAQKFGIAPFIAKIKEALPHHSSAESLAPSARG